MIGLIRSRFERAIGRAINKALDHLVQNEPVEEILAVPPALEPVATVEVEENKKEAPKPAVTFKEEISKVVDAWVEVVRPLMDGEGKFLSEDAVDKALVTYYQMIMCSPLNNGDERGPVHKEAQACETSRVIHLRAKETLETLKAKRAWYLNTTLDNAKKVFDSENLNCKRKAWVISVLIIKHIVSGSGNREGCLKDASLNGRLERLFVGNKRGLWLLGWIECLGAQVRFSDSVSVDRQSEHYRKGWDAANEDREPLNSEHLAMRVDTTLANLRRKMDPNRKVGQRAKLIDACEIVGEHIVGSWANIRGTLEEAFASNIECVELMQQVYAGIESLARKEPSLRNALPVWTHPKATQVFGAIRKLATAKSMPKGKDNQPVNKAAPVKEGMKPQNDPRVEKSKDRLRAALQLGDSDKVSRLLNQMKNDFPSFNWDKFLEEQRKEVRLKQSSESPAKKGGKKKGKKSKDEEKSSKSGKKKKGQAA